MKLSHINALAEAAENRSPVAFCIRLTDGFAHIFPDPEMPTELSELAATALAMDQSETVIVGDTKWFIEARNPAPRIIVVGAVHIAQELSRLATQVGFEMIIVDPRRAFSTADRFLGGAIRTEWPDEAIDKLAPDRRTAVVALAHDPKLDDPALIRALSSEAFYVGALGSVSTHAKRLGRLREAGVADSSMARLWAPVGLDIGARSAAEIAVSIMAEIIAARHGKLHVGDRRR